MFETGNDSWGGVFENIFEKFLENKKSPPDSLNREENVGEKILNCELLCGNSEKTVFSSILEETVLSWYITESFNELTIGINEIVNL